jgi:uncharacterized cupin superfamily protein
MTKSLINKQQIEAMAGTDKTHFLNENAQRVNKSLGDLAVITGFGFHIIEIKPGFESTEKHRHYHEDECVYVLAGSATAYIGDDVFTVNAGDFIGYPAGGEAHKLVNNSAEVLRCIVVGQRLDHDVADYPDLGKRIFRQKGLPWNLVDIAAISEPVAGKK